MKETLSLTRQRVSLQTLKQTFTKQFINHHTVTAVMGVFASASTIALFTSHDMAACALGMGAFALASAGTTNITKFCGFKFLPYLCDTFHFERAMRLANIAGINFAQYITRTTVSTPVWSVNAPTARSEWKVTGKRNRFLCSALNN